MPKPITLIIADEEGTTLKPVLAPLFRVKLDKRLAGHKGESLSCKIDYEKKNFSCYFP